MKYSLFSWAQVVAGRLLMRAAVRLLGEQHAGWARAMQAEVAAVDSEREALSFAWGCFWTAFSHALRAAHAGLAQVHNAGVLACSATVLVGCAFMYSSGAPGHYVWMNLLSLAFALATFRLLPRRRLQTDELLRAKLSFAMGALLFIASLGQAAMVASAWVRVGTIPVNLAWLLLPALLVAADVGPKSTARPWAIGGLLLASLALALQGDAVLAAVAAAVLSVRAFHRRSGALALLAVATWAIAVHFGQRWQAPAPLPFVDLVLQRGFQQSATIGIVLALLQALPLWPALRHKPARMHGLVWGLLVALSLPGWLPSPLLGFGGSFIVAFMLSLMLLGDDSTERPAAGPRRAAARATWDPPTLSRSGLT